MKKVFVVCAVAALVLGMSGCASTKSVDPTLKVNVDDDVDKVVVIDWTDRTLGEVAASQWLKNMRRGNSDTFKQQWGTDATRRNSPTFSLSGER